MSDPGQDLDPARVVPTEEVAGAVIGHAANDSPLGSCETRIEEVTDMADQRSTAVVPMLAYEDPATAITWLERAFGFREQADERYTDENGTIGHAQLEAGEGLIMLASPTPDYQSPKHHREAVRAGGALVARPVGDRRRSGRDRRRRRPLRSSGRGRGEAPVRDPGRAVRAAVPCRGSGGPSLDVHPASLTTPRGRGAAGGVRACCARARSRRAWPAARRSGR